MPRALPRHTRIVVPVIKAHTTILGGCQWPSSSTKPGRSAPLPAPGKLLIQLITPGWGSSGYYSAEVLEQAANDKVFAKGTQMHIDHMSTR